MKSILCLAAILLLSGVSADEPRYPSVRDALRREGFDEFLNALINEGLIGAVDSNELAAIIFAPRDEYLRALLNSNIFQDGSLLRYVLQYHVIPVPTEDRIFEEDEVPNVPMAKTGIQPSLIPGEQPGSVSKTLVDDRYVYTNTMGLITRSADPNEIYIASPRLPGNANGPLLVRKDESFLAGPYLGRISRIFPLYGVLVPPLTSLVPVPNAELLGQMFIGTPRETLFLGIADNTGSEVPPYLTKQQTIDRFRRLDHRVDALMSSTQIAVTFLIPTASDALNLMDLIAEELDYPFSHSLPKVMRNHIIPDFAYTKEDLINIARANPTGMGSITTQAGFTLEFYSTPSRNGGTDVFVRSLGNAHWSRIIDADNMRVKSMVHFIDSVLLPPLANFEDTSKPLVINAAGSVASSLKLLSMAALAALLLSIMAHL